MQVNETGSFVPTVVAFCCNWCSYAGADLSGTNRLQYPSNIKIIRVPCSCRVNPMFILRAFQRGADGVILRRGLLPSCPQPQEPCAKSYRLRSCALPL